MHPRSVPQDAVRTPYAHSDDAEDLTLRGMVLCMDGKLRARDRCVHCGGSFAGEKLLCPCKRWPQKGIFIDFHHKGERFKITADRAGYTFTDPRHATRALEAIRYEVDRGIFDPINYRAKSLARLRIEAIAREWLTIRKAKVGKAEGISLSTYQHDEVLVEGFIIPYLGSEDIREVKLRRLELFLVEIQRSPKTERETKATTRKAIMDVLRKLFKAALAWEDIEKMPEFPSTPVVKPSYRLPTETERADIFVHATEVDRPIFTFLRFEPVRPDEACQLVPSDVIWRWRDPDTGRTMPVVQVRAEIRKAGETIILPLHAEVEAMLRRHESRGPFLFSYDGKPRGTIRQYCTERLDTLWARMREAARQAAMERAPALTPTAAASLYDYCLYEASRHYISSHAVNNGADLGAVQAALGHSSPATTARYYVRYKPGSLVNVITPKNVVDCPGTVPESETGA